MMCQNIIFEGMREARIFALQPAYPREKPLLESTKLFQARKDGELCLRKAQSRGPETGSGGTYPGLRVQGLGFGVKGFRGLRFWGFRV